MNKYKLSCRRAAAWDGVRADKGDSALVPPAPRYAMKVA